MVSSRLSLSFVSTRALAAALLVLLAVASPGRLQALDGQLDLTFGGGAGVRAVAFDLGGTLNDYCSGIVAAADGTLFAVGSSDSQTGDLDWTVAKLNEGVAPLKHQLYFDLGGTNDDRAQAVALDRSGRLLVAGSSEAADRTELRVCRLLPAALSNDPDFNSGSCVAYQLGAQTWLVPRAIAESPTGGVLIAGTLGFDQGSGTDFDWFVLELTTAGAPNPFFGVSGLSVVPWNLTVRGQDLLSGMAVDPIDGSIALVGTAHGTLFVGALARLTAAGDLDLGFGVQGRTTWVIPYIGLPAPTLGIAVIRDPIGNGYWVGGFVEMDPEVSTYLLLSRFDSAGGYLGSVPEDWGDTEDYPKGLLLQSDRKLVLPGDSASGVIFRAGRFSLNGSSAPSLDLSYGSSAGVAFYQPGATGWGTGAFVCAATLDAGRVVLLADVLRPDRDWLVIRLQNSSIFVDGFEPGNTSQWSVTQP